MRNETLFPYTLADLLWTILSLGHLYILCKYKCSKGVRPFSLIRKGEKGKTRIAQSLVAYCFFLEKEFGLSVVVYKKVA